MTAEDIHCPICRMPARKSTVWDRLDYVIECPRCKAFQIDRRAFINLDRGSDAPNAAVLSGIARRQYDSCGEIPRLSWIRLEDDRDGRYEFDGTESLRLSAQATERLIREDWSAVGRIIRNAAWNSQLISFPAELEQLCVAVQSKSGIRKLLETLEVSSDLPAAKNEAADDTNKDIASFLPELEDFDLRVFKTACELLLQQERFQSLISVPGIARELDMDNDPAGDVGAAVRLLVELNYLQGTDPSNPRFVLVRHPAFRRYLECYILTYSRDFQRAKVAIVNGEADCDASLAAWLKLPRPLTEYFLVDLGESRLISIQGYNAGVNVTGISERLRRQVLVFGDRS